MNLTMMLKYRTYMLLLDELCVSMRMRRSWHVVNGLLWLVISGDGGSIHVKFVGQSMAVMEFNEYGGAVRTFVETEDRLVAAFHIGQCHATCQARAEQSRLANDAREQLAKERAAEIESRNRFEAGC